MIAGEFWQPWFLIQMTQHLNVVINLILGPPSKCRLLNIHLIRKFNEKYNEIYGNQRKIYNLQHELQIILF